MSSGGDLPSGYVDNTDALIIKMDATGAVQWSKYWGAQDYDYASSVIQTSDGGFIIAGATASSFGGANHGDNDGFVIKLDASGALQWQKLYGGSGMEDIACIRQNPDGTFIFAGSTSSPEVAGFHGSYDVWVVKLDIDGTIIWEKAKGYSDLDDAYSIELTADGGYILGCNTQSPGATNYHGSSDLWVLKLTAAGAIAWQQCIGGTGVENGCAAIETADSGIMVLGYSSTNNNGDAIGNHGQSDIFLAKLNASGSLIYSKLYGGTKEDYYCGIKQTQDGGFIIAGSTESENGDVSGNNGAFDVWLLKVDSLGNLEWQQCLGGGGNDYANCIAFSTDGGFVVGGRYNQENAWIVKMKGNNTSIANLNQNANLNLFPNPTSDILNMVIDWENSQSSTLTIYDITGRVCLLQNLEQAEHSQTQIDVSKLPVGSYYLKIESADGQMAKAFQVVK